MSCAKKPKNYIIKVRSAVKKRFSKTASGKIKSLAAFNRHGMLKQNTRRNREKSRILSLTEMKTMSKLIIK